MGERKEMVQGKRNVNLDLIRCVAIVSVLSVHSFIRVPFTEELFVGKYMWLLTMMRTFFTVCVPLFVMLSGYLCINKKLEKGYFKKLVPVLLTYLLASISTALLRKSWGEDIEIVFSVLNIAGDAVPYSWYVEMYIGLFLLIPFLNASYHGMETKRNKQMLIAVLLVLTTVPSMLNIHDWRSMDTLLQYGNPEEVQRVFPNWWRSLWPLDFYFIGAYIREYDIPIKKRWNILLLAGSLVVVTSFLFYRSYNSMLFYDLGGDYGSFDKLIHSVLTFLVLLHLDLSGLPDFLCQILARVSKLAFGIYLCSYASDVYVYSKLMSLADTTRQKHMLMPLAVMLSFALAAIGAQLIDWILSAPKWIKKHVH